MAKCKDCDDTGVVQYDDAHGVPRSAACLCERTSNQQLRVAPTELLARCREVKAALDATVRDGEPVHPQSSALTWPMSSAVLALESSDETSGQLFPRAWGSAAANGWTIDQTLLIAIHDEIRGQDFATSQEGVELVLLAYERIRGGVKTKPPQCDTKCFDWPNCECARRMP